MQNLKILLTGDYWHSDFQRLIGAAAVPITLQPLPHILAGSNRQSSDYGAVIIAQSRRGQFESEQLEQLISQFVNTPVIALCGSWCEGEPRSGTPVAGLVRVYWHSWLGQFDHFVAELKKQKIATWQLPKIASAADRIMHQSQNGVVGDLNSSAMVGISTHTRDHYLMMRDALTTSNYNSCWIEGLDENDIQQASLDAICIEGNSLNPAMQERIVELQRNFPLVPMALVLNFPRSLEFSLARRMGISEIISKPFQLCDLNFAIERLRSTAAA